MNKDQKTTLAFSIIALALILGYSYHWNNTTIIADASPPHIIESATTSGDLVYGSGKPKVMLLFTENLGVQTATATIYNVASFNTLGQKIEEITLTQTNHNGEQYQFEGRFTKTLEPNKEYFIIYKVTDTSGHSDTIGKDTLGRGNLKIKLVQIQAKIYVNGIEIKHTSDKIYVDTHNLFIETTVTTGAPNIETVYATINTQRIDFTQSGSKWITTYKLPGDGQYTLYVKIQDTTGSSTILASFSIELGKQQRTPIILATLGALILAIIWFNKPQGGKQWAS